MIDDGFDLLGNPFREAMLGSFAYGNGKTAVQSVDAKVGPVQGIQLLIGSDAATLIGNDQVDVAFHTGYGAVYGRGGNDLIFAIGMDVQAEGEQLLLDGGDGDDIVISLGGQGIDFLIGLKGQRAVTAGGLGRDWIYNTSDGGVIWGDVIGGLYEKPVINADGTVGTAPGRPDDSAANADNIWYAPNVKVMDAQHSDVLKFYGFTLTGGDANGGLAAAALFNGAMGAVAGSANFAFSGGDWRNQVYFDHLLPWMTYMFQADEDGNLDMYITNQFDQLFQAVFGGDAGEEYERRQALAAQGIHKGWMKIENVDVVGSAFGRQQAGFAGQGTFNMVFRVANPIWDILQALPPTLLSFAATGGGPLVDAAFSTAAAVQRFAGGMKWSKPADPLVIDLDGDGIEFTEIGLGSTWFDVDGDLFAERTGWLKGDDGFLVLDGNGNGRIDDVSEMFGGVDQSGFAELAQLDSNGDGRITLADVAWSELKVWQDYNRDGVSDAGELKTLDELGIVSLDVTAQAMDITTQQGARLTGYGKRSRRAAAASNDNEGAWPERPFCFG